MSSPRNYYIDIFGIDIGAEELIELIKSVFPVNEIYSVKNIKGKKLLDEKTKKQLGDKYIFSQEEYDLIIIPEYEKYAIGFGSPFGIRINKENIRIEICSMYDRPALDYLIDYLKGIPLSVKNIPNAEKYGLKHIKGIYSGDFWEYREKNYKLIEKYLQRFILKLISRSEYLIYWRTWECFLTFAVFFFNEKYVPKIKIEKDIRLDTEIDFEGRKGSEKIAHMLDLSLFFIVDYKGRISESKKLDKKIYSHFKLD